MRRKPPQPIENAQPQRSQHNETNGHHGAESEPTRYQETNRSARKRRINTARIYALQRPPSQCHFERIGIVSGHRVPPFAARQEGSQCQFERLGIVRPYWNCDRCANHRLAMSVRATWNCEGLSQLVWRLYRGSQCQFERIGIVSEPVISKKQRQITSQCHFKRIGIVRWRFVPRPRR